MKGLTIKQEAVVRKNLDAFIANFGSPRFERIPYQGGILVYYPSDSRQYIQECPSIDYLNGWLYGCVQGHLRAEFKRAEGKSGGVYDPSFQDG